jgi:hypothetical protein
MLYSLVWGFTKNLGLVNNLLYKHQKWVLHIIATLPRVQGHNTVF